MAIRKAFLHEAKRIADDIRAQDRALQQEEEKVAEQLNEIEEKRSNFAQVNTRLNTYPSIQSEDPCPRCWLFDGVPRKMIPRGQDEHRDDIFWCFHCDDKIIVKD